jgi:ABC-type thiamine transport system ATPase subunit
VTFSYPGAEPPCSRHLVRRGTRQTTAIIGSTGAGKTTLISLIPRLFDATEGAVQRRRRRRARARPRRPVGSIGLVPQKPYLFTGTVASNLRYGKPDATDEELWHALEVAQARDFVEAMPGQLEPPIAQGGTNVSGGQRQRLSIARALVRRPSVYIFDDSFSALDVTTDARLRAALAGETRGRRRRHRRPARRHHRGRRPDHRPRRRPHRGDRDARATARDLPHLRRDRRIPVHLAGGSMTDTAQETSHRVVDAPERPKNGPQQRGHGPMGQQGPLREGHQLRSRRCGGCSATSVPRCPASSS